MLLSGYFGFFVARDHHSRREVITLAEAIDLDNKRPWGYFSGSRSDEKYMWNPVCSGGHLLVFTCPVVTMNRYV